MGGLNTALNIGMQALDVSEAALNTIGNNISNANTPGYTDETVDVSSNAITLSGGILPAAVSPWTRSRAAATSC